MATFKIGRDVESLRNAAERFLDAKPEQVDSIVKNVLEGSLRSIVGTLTIEELIRDRQKPTIALCMGEAGLISRVLAKKFGGFLTFASLEPGKGTASGQVESFFIRDLGHWAQRSAQETIRETNKTRPRRVRSKLPAMDRTSIRWPSDLCSSSCPTANI